MSSQTHIVGFAGSLRKESYNKALLRAACDLLPDGMDLEIIELHALPLFNQDIEEHPPQEVIVFREKIQAAHALLLATPEYNYSISGVLKNALDWASRPPGQGVILGKPTAIMGCSPSRFGTLRAQLHLRQIMFALNMPAVMRPEVLVTNAAEHFDQAGRLTNERTRTQLAELLKALQELTNQVHSCQSDSI